VTAEGKTETPDSIRVIYASDDFPRGREGRRELAIRVALHEDIASQVKAGTLDRTGMDRLARSAIRSAGKKHKELVATHVVDYDEFDSDSAYLDTIDRVVDGMKLLDVQLAGPARRYAVDGIYSEGDQQWSDWEQATCAGEAEWRGALSMAANEFGHDLPFTELMDYAAAMVVNAAAEPVTRDEFRDLLRAVSDQAGKDGYRSAALTEARAALALADENAGPESSNETSQSIKKDILLEDTYPQADAAEAGSAGSGIEEAPSP